MDAFFCSTRILIMQFSISLLLVWLQKNESISNKLAKKQRKKFEKERYKENNEGIKFSLVLS